MPMGCKCTDNGKLASTIVCGMKLLDLDQFYITLNLSPCAQASAFSVVVSETRLGFKFPITGLNAGQSKQVLIPGLAAGIPGVAGVGVTLDVEFGGNIASFYLKLGINACGKVLGQTMCGSSLTKSLPLNLFDYTYKFSDVCASAK